jgi:hypothetical protein
MVRFGSRLRSHSADRKFQRNNLPAVTLCSRSGAKRIGAIRRGQSNETY